jgi:hypothetical protein
LLLLLGQVAWERLQQPAHCVRLPLLLLGLLLALVQGQPRRLLGLPRSSWPARPGSLLLLLWLLAPCWLSQQALQLLAWLLLQALQQPCLWCCGPFQPQRLLLLLLLLPAPSPPPAALSLSFATAASHSLLLLLLRVLPMLLRLPCWQQLQVLLAAPYQPGPPSAAYQPYWLLPVPLRLLLLLPLPALMCWQLQEHPLLLLLLSPSCRHCWWRLLLLVVQLLPGSLPLLCWLLCWPW